MIMIKLATKTIFEHELEITTTGFGIKGQDNKDKEIIIERLSQLTKMLKPKHLVKMVKNNNCLTQMNDLIFVYCDYEN